MDNYELNDIHEKIRRTVKKRKKVLFIEYIKKENFPLIYLLITTIITYQSRNNLSSFYILLALIEILIIILCAYLHVKQYEYQTYNNHLKAKKKKPKFVEKLITDETKIGLKIISALILSIIFAVFYNPFLLKETFLFLYGLIFFDIFLGVYWGDFHFTLCPKKLYKNIKNKANQLKSLLKKPSKIAEIFFLISSFIALILHLKDVIKNVKLIKDFVL